MPGTIKGYKKDRLGPAKGDGVLMTMDISFRSHSHIIGRSGEKIEKIMNETQTQIHFPDSNLLNLTEISNFVSIRGTIDGVEKARSLIRLSLPLIVSYKLPFDTPGMKSCNINSRFVKKIEKEFEVQVGFNKKPNKATTIVVKGSEKDPANVISATKKLMKKMFRDDQAVDVKMRLQISPQNHPVLIGKDSKNLREIVKGTNTKIMFPDANKTSISKAFEITIIGTIDGVHRAKQQLQGNIPIVLVFNVQTSIVDSKAIAKLTQTNDVQISCNKKTHYSIITITGVEKFVANIYKARNDLLKLEAEKISTATGSRSKDFASFKNRSISQLFPPVLTTKDDIKKLHDKDRKRVTDQQANVSLPHQQKMPISHAVTYNPFSFQHLAASMPNIPHGYEHKPMKERELNFFRPQVEPAVAASQYFYSEPIRYNGSLAPGDELKALQRWRYSLMPSQDGLNYM